LFCEDIDGMGSFWPLQMDELNFPPMTVLIDSPDSMILLAYSSHGTEKE